jgi:hypothetical protein
VVWLGFQHIIDGIISGEGDINVGVPEQISKLSYHGTITDEDGPCFRSRGAYLQ